VNLTRTNHGAMVPLPAPADGRCEGAGYWAPTHLPVIDAGQPVSAARCARCGQPVGHMGYAWERRTERVIYGSLAAVPR